MLTLCKHTIFATSVFSKIALNRQIWPYNIQQLAHNHVSNAPDASRALKIERIVIRKDTGEVDAQLFQSAG